MLLKFKLKAMMSYPALARRFDYVSIQVQDPLVDEKFFSSYSHAAATSTANCASGLFRDRVVPRGPTLPQPSAQHTS
jgi:hypothetical protein